MLSKSTLSVFVAATLVIVRGQTIPDISSFPVACSTSCGSTIETISLCTTEQSTSLSIAACFCVGLPSTTELTVCSSCLSSDSQSAMAMNLMAVGQACGNALQTCAFECSFDTCQSSDVKCQCSETYLQNILQCASCNSQYGNTNVTLLSNYQTLADSCKSQNYTAIPKGTTSLPSPTGQSTYKAPTLTFTGTGVVSSSASQVTVVTSLTNTIATLSTTTTSSSSVPFTLTRASSSGSMGNSTSGSTSRASATATGGTSGARMNLNLDLRSGWGMGMGMGFLGAGLMGSMRVLLMV